MYYPRDTIAAVSTAMGGALNLIRVSGQNAITIVNAITKKDITQQKSHTTRLNYIIDENQKEIDEVMITVFHAPKSFTTENVVEITAHGSPYLAEKILSLLVQNGARIAQKGEFTLRAFWNGRLDLAQAEAIADLINAQNAQMHRIAWQQMKGGLSQKMKTLRQDLIHFTALMELELDFAEEDVEFANRQQFIKLLQDILTFVGELLRSFKYGNALKKGVPVAIIGKPNAGKSTLLNALLEEEKAIVSPIPGTTRDVIEDTLTIQEITFRFMDTAGLRDTTDTIEQIGVAKTLQKIQEAEIILYVCSANPNSNQNEENIYQAYQTIQTYRNNKKDAQWVILANKVDIYPQNAPTPSFDIPVLYLSAKEKQGIDQLKAHLLHTVRQFLPDYQTALILTNQRHFELLSKTYEHLKSALQGFQDCVNTELISIDVKHALHYLGQVTGEVTPNDVLADIFANFCIGK
ncbi:MAG: tRNA uridine-5-carboxymethylaminomethyl(34) synthesis GTPase MnmE [Bacteroidia bacterium]|nr:tRNA uridine-5-carboxymethylaminomethyl(34) synthesis GTPase MnmE [Bacteroidia bacterium]MDW8301028.1 tRNA uridine-5-carboxymethylaminomethyl(34) synthesis GTPase MnmE [Bacteroidia bacterium]